MAQNPIERMAMAMTPAKTPGPDDGDQQQRPDQRVDRAGRDDDEQRDGPDEAASTGVVLRAARNATGTARNSAAIVPRVAMLSVSQIGHPELVDIGPARRRRAVRDVAGDARRIPDEEPGGRVAKSAASTRRRPRRRSASRPSAPASSRRGAALPDLAAVGSRADRHYCTLARMMPERYSSAMTMTMMMIRIAAAVSNS